MARRRLGKTELEVTALGLGCWQFSSGYGPMKGYWADVDQPTVDAIVAGALKGGIDWVDTAELYGKGKSEQALSKALLNAGKKPGEVTVATKWAPILRTPTSIQTTIGTRLEKLAPFGIDLYQVHFPASLGTVEDEMRQMAALVREKKIRAVGVSNFSARQMRRAHAELQRQGLTLATNQVRFNLADREQDRNGVVAAAKELGVTLIAFSPLGQGLLTGRFHEDPNLVKQLAGPRRMLPKFRRLESTRPLIDELKKVAQAHGATAAQVALAWTVQFHRETVVAIPGATKLSQLEDNVKALGLELSRAELDGLDAVSM